MTKHSQKERVATVRLNEMSADALEIMKREDVEYVAVVSADSGSVLGVVRRRGLVRGCEGMGHRPETCAVWNHLKTDVPIVSESEWENRTSAAQAGQPNCGPVITIDERGRPVRILNAGPEGARV